MNSTTVILTALVLAFILIAGVYGLADAVIETGDSAVDNLSDRADVGENEEPSFTSLESDREINQIVKNSPIQRRVHWQL